MSTLAELQARIKADSEALAEAIKNEKVDALKRIKAEIKLYGFNGKDFKGMFKTRITQKQVDEFTATKAANANKVVTKRASKTSR
jgi:hypothetical protein